MKHRIIWFKTLEGGVPVGGGEREEDSFEAWDMAEAFRLEQGVNLEAYVPVVDDLRELAEAEWPEPTRALEVVSPDRLEAMRPETIRIKDRYGMTRDVSGQAIADWLGGYRQLWEQGFVIVRTASE